MLEDLNEQQRNAVLGSFAQDTLVLAGAGAGKSKTIVERVKYILDEKHAEPSSIMCITFTNKAAHELLDRVKKVCKEVGLHHFIKTLPNGYDSKISDNDSVSAGQRQLLTIARGMIQDSPFLILDEATSNVDTRTEELVQVAMDKLTEGRTSFIIAHRLSTIKNADLILVMKDGNIVEQGNHEQLMAKNGAYAELYNSQFEL